MQGSSLSESFGFTLQTYRHCAKLAAERFIKNWALVPVCIVCWALLQAAATLLAPLGMVGGFIYSVSGFCLLTLFYGWISEIYSGAKLRMRDFLSFDLNMLLSIVSVSFIIFVVEWMLGSLLLGFKERGMVLALLRLGIVFVFNALPEIVYLARRESVGAFQEAATFTKQHWIEWFIPYVIFLAPLLVVSPAAIPLVLADTYPLLPVAPVFAATHLWFAGEAKLFASVLGLVLALWFVLFRAELFRELSTGSARKRAFLAKQRG